MLVLVLEFLSQRCVLENLSVGGDVSQSKFGIGKLKSNDEIKNADEQNVTQGRITYIA